MSSPSFPSVLILADLPGGPEPDTSNLQYPGHGACSSAARFWLDSWCRGSDFEILFPSSCFFPNQR